LPATVARGTVARCRPVLYGELRETSRAGSERRVSIEVPERAAPDPSARPFVRERASGPRWYAKWSRNGRPVIRALGRAWVESDGNGGWRRKRGRPPEGMLTEAQAAERMLRLVREHHEEQTLLERDAEERRRRGVSFRELATDYLHWLEDVKGPSHRRCATTARCWPNQVKRSDVGPTRREDESCRRLAIVRRARSRRARSKTCSGRSRGPVSLRGPSTRRAS
jgi:hypothetical protein